MTDIVSTLDRLPALLAATPALVRGSARARLTLLIGGGDLSRRLILHDGTLNVAGTDGPMDGWDIALRGDARVWADHWRAPPAPDASDIFAMRRHGRLAIEGNFLPFMQHLQAIKDILALPREAT